MKMQTKCCVVVGWFGALALTSTLALALSLALADHFSVIVMSRVRVYSVKKVKCSVICKLNEKAQHPITSRAVIAANLRRTDMFFVNDFKAITLSYALSLAKKS
uniref:Uncharacterized protein n=1 Tax=Glossina pallidipes TaxID=7398 RepID=A0A1A9Z4U0_GLOPL